MQYCRKYVKGFLGLLFIVVIMLGACDAPRDVETVITAVTFDESQVDSPFEIRDFMLDSLVVTVTYDDGSTELITLTSDMFEAEELALLTDPGEHTIMIRYEGFTIPITLYLEATEAVVSVTFETVGGSAVETIRGVAGATIEQPDNPIKAGYVFEGWFLSDEGEHPYVFNVMPDNDLTLYARWEAMHYIVIFEDDAGNTLKTDTVGHGKDATAPDVPARVGHTFSHWDKALSSITENTTIRAVYIINQYTIAFDSAGGSDVEAITQDFGTEVTVPTDPSKPGHTFIEWQRDGALYPFATIPSENIVLAAIWEANEYTVAFEVDGALYDTLTVTFGQPIGTLPADPDTPQDQVFYAWLDAFDNVYTETTIYDVVGDVILTANFVAETDVSYTVLYAFEDETGHFVVDDDLTMTRFGTSGQTVIAPALDALIDGFVLKGDLPEGVITTVGDGLNLTVYYERITLAVIFSYFEADEAATKTVDVKYGLTVEAPILDERTGHVFTNWNKPLENITESQTIVAQYTVLLFTISFDSAGGSEVENITQPFGTAITAPANPTKADHIFIGWNPVVPNTMPAEAIRLVAQWDMHVYTITYVLNQGTNHPENLDGIIASTETFVFHAPTKVGHTFLGWYENASFEGEAITQVDAADLRDYTLYAKWEIKAYMLSYHIFGVSEIVDAIPFMTDETFIDMSLGNGYTAGLTSAGRLFMWGLNWGQLGDGTTNDQLIPVDITDQFGLDAHETIARVATGNEHSAALTSQGRLFMWGNNDSRQLGDGSSEATCTPTETTHMFHLMADETIVNIFTGSYHSAALTSEGRLFTWGANWFGQIGDGSTSMSAIPIDITDQFMLEKDEIIIDAALGRDYSAALSSEGRLFMWGHNGFGRLGDDSTEHRHTPTDITSHFSLLAQEHIIQIDLGNEHSSALTSEGRLYMWGRNAYGQLGDDTTTDRFTPTDVTDNFYLNPLERIKTISLGSAHSAALTSEDRLFIFGYNLRGQIGDGTNTNKQVPIDITDQFAIETEAFIDNMFLGTDTTAVLRNDGTMFLWGWNIGGQLGDGTTDDRNHPAPIEGFVYPIHHAFALIDYDADITLDIFEIEGHTVSDWYNDLTFNTLFLMDAMPAHPINLFALGSLKSYTVSFETDGEAMAALMLPYGSDVTTFIPEKENHTFLGWYLEPTYDTMVVVVPSMDVTLYAKWKAGHDIIVDIDMVTVGEHGMLYTIPYGRWDNETRTVEGGFEMASMMTTYAVWYEVRLWAEANGYHFEHLGQEGSAGAIGEVPSAAQNEPVTMVSWRDVVVWLNALSELHGYEPVYRSAEGHVITDARDDSAVETLDYDGYRLPATEEWELAARWKHDTTSTHGSIFLDGRYWTPGNYASGATNHTSDEMATSEVAWHVSNSTKTMPVGQLQPNHLGIYDMSGNAWEFTSTIIAGERLIRGARYGVVAVNLQVGNYHARDLNDPFIGLGFRIVRDGAPQTMFTVVFEDDDGTVLSEQSVVEGASATPPDAPTREGYTFNGWNQAYDIVTEPLRISAMYTVNTYNLVYFEADGTTIMQLSTYPYGASLSEHTLPEAPDLTEQLFEGWEALPETMPANDLMYVANYTIIDTDFTMVKVGEDDTSYIIPTGVEDDKTATLDGGFTIATTQTTYALWYEVRVWAEANAYYFENLGREGSHGAIGLAPTHAAYEPVTDITWHDIIVWLNALSEMHDKDPVYRDLDQNVIKDARFSNEAVLNAAIETVHNGYRLPRHEEWEMAARWKNDIESIDGSILIGGRYWTPGNYASGATDTTLNKTATQAVAWTVDNAGGKTHAVGLLLPNDLGIYDMTGNVYEWTTLSSDGERFLIGGCWQWNGTTLQIGFEGGDYHPSLRSINIGFRFVRNP